MEQSSSLEHESQHKLQEVLEGRTDSLPVASDNDGTETGEETSDQEEVNEVDEPTVKSAEDEHSITDSIVQITKSQVLASEQEEEAHNKAEFITSTNEHMIESTYHDEEAENLEKQEDDVEDEEKDEEVESEAEAKEDEGEQDQGQEEEEEEEVTGAEKILDVLENSEELQNQILELQQSLITSVDLVRIKSTNNN